MLTRRLIVSIAAASLLPVTMVLAADAAPAYEPDAFKSVRYPLEGAPLYGDEKRLDRRG